MSASSFAMLESLEGRQFMSVANDIGLSDPLLSARPRPFTPAVVRPLFSALHGGAMTMSASPGGAASGGTPSGGAAAAAAVEPDVDINLLVGKYKSGKSMIFAPRLQIKTVSSTGQVRGKYQLPWIINQATVKGTISPTGRFSLKIVDTTKSETDPGRYMGTFKGKMSSDGNKLNGTFKSWNGPTPDAYANSHKSTFQRT
jgi:hypothetical protein